MGVEYKIPELPIFKDDGLPPKVYYRLKEAADMLRTTPDGLIHYGATARIEFVTPRPRGLSVFTKSVLTEDTDFPFDAPELLALSTYSIREIELSGKTTETSFSHGYEIWSDLLIYRDPSPETESDRSRVRPIWVFRLYDKSLAESTALEVTSDSLFVVAPELDRFKQGGAPSLARSERGANSRDERLSQNKPKNLSILNRAFTKWWANADRDDRSTHPNKSDVVAWLIERGFSQKLADSGATIIRPEWAPTGRKAEE